jgi:hypothetical protein
MNKQPTGKFTELICNKGTKNTNGERAVFSINSAKEIGYTYAEE